MPFYHIEVIETRTYCVLYDIEAEDETEAREMASTGETVGEEELEFVGVTDRQVKSP